MCSFFVSTFLDCYNIFWLPTFRAPLDQLNELTEKGPEGETGLPVVGKVKELQCLNQLFEEHDAVMVVKLHPFQNKEWIHMGNDLKQNKVLLTNDVLNGFEECAEKRHLPSGKMQKWANDCNSERFCSALGIGNSSDC